MTNPKTFEVASSYSGWIYEEMRCSEVPTLNALFSKLHLSPTGHSVTVQTADKEAIDDVPLNYKFSNGEYVIINKSQHKGG